TPDGREKFATYMRDGFGQDYADQRYYNANMGAFWSPDPGGIWTANARSPLSWNRYTYVNGDPVNHRDRHGMDSVSLDGGDDTDYDGDGSWSSCDDMTTKYEPSASPCQSAGGGGPDDDPSPSPAPTPAPCWTNLSNIGTTLTELGENIEEVAAGVISNGTELAALASVISGDISSEASQIGAMIAAGGPPTGPDFVGGHFNLIISTSQLTGALGSDFQSFSKALGGNIDGTRQAAVYGNAAQGNYTLHSKQHGGKNGYFNAHFDIYNPATDVVSAIGHLFGDVIAGHAGSPCLDPAWN
ncbi:MAG: RHS repeat-associated core domain-containing protein, partial [Bryobacteraceae bacterium]